MRHGIKIQFTELRGEQQREIKPPNALKKSSTRETMPPTPCREKIQTAYQQNVKTRAHLIQRLENDVLLQNDTFITRCNHFKKKSNRIDNIKS